MNRKTGVLTAVLLCLILAFGMCGGAWADVMDEEPIDGGTINRTDYSAPKEIESDTIVGFDAHFFLFTRWKTDDTDIEFRFLVKEDDEGVLMASEEILGISRPADEELLDSLQEVIRENDLVSMNGVYEFTAGLAPEFSECELTVAYDSGESIRFTIGNNPYALWSEEVYDVFAEWFAANGDDSLYPPQEDSQVNRFRLDFTDKGICAECYDVHVDKSEAIDGETYLLCIRVSDAETYEDLVEEYLLFPDDYFEPITQIVSSYDLNRHYDFSRYDHDNGSYDMHDLGYYGMGGLSPADGEEDSEDMYLSIHLEYESGHRVNIDTGKESEIKGLKPLLTELLLYHDNLLWDTSEKTFLEYLPEEFREAENAGAE